MRTLTIGNRRQPPAPLVALAAALASLLVPAAAAQEASECLACHADKVPEARFAASAHAPFGCVACHTDIGLFPHPAKVTPPDCAVCHADAVAAWQRSIHGEARAQGVQEAAACADCHGDVHGVVPHAHPDSPMHRLRQASTCAQCHANPELAARFRIPIVRPVESYRESVHARAVAAGREGAVCADCHGSHTIQPGWDPRSSVWRSKVPETCGTCHQQVLADYRDSVHGQALVRHVRDAPTCTDCHGEHRILGRAEPASPVFTTNIPTETCGRCHGNVRLSQRYGLPLEKLPSFQDSYHGLALRAGNQTVANCASCHGVHDILPSSDPRSRVHAANLPQTCGQCHPGAGARFALGPVHVLPVRALSPLVYWIRLLYLWVIGLVIGAMVLHNLFDFIHKARRPAPPPRLVPRDQPERMTRELRWQHGLVMLSFPLLVYTGFALTYPESWWAAPVLHWEAQFGLRGWLHRAAAVVLMASLVWHVLHLAFSARLRARLEQMRWSRADLNYLRAMLSFYLGRRELRPHAGKFSYIEKAEYWAFLWGMVVMSLTGLLLWSVNFSLRYLPKWVTDVATAIHFYEAVLASLAILVWHFYWVIFDPDVYPMDTTWWHGRSPLARLLERGLEATPGDTSPHGATPARQPATPSASAEPAPGDAPNPQDSNKKTPDE